MLHSPIYMDVIPMEPELKKPISFNSQADLSSFLDANCNSWNPSRNGQDLKADLNSATFPPELQDLVGIEFIALGFFFIGCKAEPEGVLTTDAGEEVVMGYKINQLNEAAFEC